MVKHGIVFTILISTVASTLAARGDEGSVLFTRHVVPVFSKLGCNAGGCHGMVQGRGGFRLSLFGANPAADYDGVVREYQGRRLNRVAPESSLILQKATGAVSHEGGQRTVVGSRDYEILHQWIASGAPLDNIEKSAIKRLTVTPASRTAKPKDRFALKATAEFVDGTRENVTHLCFFEVQNREVATVNSSGLVEILGVGDTSVVVRVPGEVGIATIVAMPAKPAVDLPNVTPRNFIDKHILARLRELDVHPSELCDDATFLRRVTIDVTGALPTAGEVRQFLDDRSPEKRTRKIEELLARPRHAALWATRFMDIMRVTGFTPATFPPDAYEEFRAYEWLRARLLENVPYDVLVERILTATTRDGRTLDEWAALAAADLQDELDRQLPKTYASRKTMDVFWKRRMATDVDHAIRVGHAFLGLRLQCAQCHRHPNDVWTQDDLLSFANFFMRIPHFTSMGGPKVKADAAVMAALQKTASSLPAKARQSIVKQFGDREIFVLTKADVEGPGMKNGKSFFSFGAKGSGFATVTSPLGTQTSKTLRYLGEPEDIDATDDGDRRAQLMAWLRQQNNPFFVKALVNRVWALYMGRGIIDPPDDLSPLNPPSHPELLKQLADEFVAHNYNLKWLHTTILNSRTYQQSSVTNERNRHDRRNFASFGLRRMPAEVLLDAYDQAAGVDLTFIKDRRPPSMPEGISLLEGGAIFYRGDTSTAFALNTFGRPARDVEVVCDCERDDQATMLQALYLANHPHARKKLAASNGQLSRILKEHSDETARIQEIFLTTIGRLPSASEVRLVESHLAIATSSSTACEMLLWSLLNSNEFVFIR